VLCIWWSLLAPSRVINGCVCCAHSRSLMRASGKECGAPQDHSLTTPKTGTAPQWPDLLQHTEAVRLRFPLITERLPCSAIHPETLLISILPHNQRMAIERRLHRINILTMELSMMAAMTRSRSHHLPNKLLRCRFPARERSHVRVVPATLAVIYSSSRSVMQRQVSPSCATCLR